MGKIRSIREAQEKFAKWKKEHPEEWKDTKPFEEPRWTYLDWKHYMESKGFTFAMTNEEFVEECEKLNLTIWERFKKWLKKKKLPEKKIKSYRRVAIIYACFGVLCLGMAFANFVILVQIHRGSELPSLEEMTKGWNSIVFLAGVACISGIFSCLGLLMLSFALYSYSCSLGLRIRQLEEKLEAVEIEQGAEEENDD